MKKHGKLSEPAKSALVGAGIGATVGGGLGAVNKYKYIKKEKRPNGKWRYYYRGGPTKQKIYLKDWQGHTAFQIGVPAVAYGLLGAMLGRAIGEERAAAKEWDAWYKSYAQRARQRNQRYRERQRERQRERDEFWENFYRSRRGTQGRSSRRSGDYSGRDSSARAGERQRSYSSGRMPPVDYEAIFKKRNVDITTFKTFKDYKKAMRSLRAKLHPDINKSPTAHEDFIELESAIEAYEKSARYPFSERVKQSFAYRRIIDAIKNWRKTT